MAQNKRKQVYVEAWSEVTTKSSCKLQAAENK
jgi:hypothetical protein